MHTNRKTLQKMPLRLTTFWMSYLTTRREMKCSKEIEQGVSLHGGSNEVDQSHSCNTRQSLMHLSQSTMLSARFCTADT